MSKKQANKEGDIKQIEHGSKPAPGLYIVATPIGNLGDITLRALETLNFVDAIICEDTRVTNKLLSHYGIKNKLILYNDYNATRVRASIIKKLELGEVMALVSDAGTPLISDPGYKLVRELREENNIGIFTIPGPSALTAAISISGMPTDKFLFAGFLPNKSGQRKKVLEEFKDVDATLIFYESASRLPAALKSIKEIFGGDRRLVIARELTKKFEEMKEGTAKELLEKINNIKGEIVMMIEPPGKKNVNIGAIDSEIVKLLENNRVKEVVNILHNSYGGSKSKIYDRVVELKNGTQG